MTIPLWCILGGLILGGVIVLFFIWAVCRASAIADSYTMHKGPGGDKW